MYTYSSSSEGIQGFNSLACLWQFVSTIFEKDSCSSPSTVRLFLSFTVYVHRGLVYRQDKEQKQNSGVKERIAHDNCVQRDAQLSWAVFLSMPFCLLFISIGMLGLYLCLYCDYLVGSVWICYVRCVQMREKEDLIERPVSFKRP